MRSGIYRNPIFWLVVALTAIALLLGLGIAYFSSDLSNLFQRRDTNRVYLNVANNLENEVLNAESGQRGYILTQDPQYLKPYSAALPIIQRDLKYIKDSPLSQPYTKNIEEITSVTNNKLAELKSTIDTLNTQGQAAAVAIVMTNVGINDMDKLRGLITTVTDSQNVRLQSDILTTEHRADVLKYLAPVAAILDIGLIAAILFLTNRALRREQQLENLKEQFVALASHQLRTPATAVKQYLGLLLAGTFGKVKNEQREVLKKINDSNERGIKIANNLLNITIADSGTVKISETPFDLTQLLQHVLTHYTEALQESKDQQVVAKYAKSSILTRVDPFQIRLIFENLIENASKYSDDHKKIYVSLQADKEWVTFSVKDHGQGIRKQDIPILFKKFSRLDKAARKTEGSGLGLYLVKQAAELHGGTVTIDSVVGKGSTFTVKIKRMD